ncbi:tRNA 2'-phosphotransferase 1 [Mizuhopecten yessoensis]|uniref:tRNA 2'-phosphotransferase 1 n=1 Tax=Mizuhopecten yessoensis TaxID=6573 RepID=A0A210PZK4_MIZYE|nr:tRNA 2'-phosphotransferase 1 [Mizuhopecten yessoensis]
MSSCLFGCLVCNSPNTGVRCSHILSAEMTLDRPTHRYSGGSSIFGLSRKRRDHIHFAQGESGQTSGFPSYCDIAIEINLNKALRDGLKFYKSENDVILSPGNASGFIPKKYFKKAYNIRTRENFSLD